MTMKDDFMYPFGNPLRDRLYRDDTRTALRNVLKLAQDKMRTANGEMEELLITADDVIANRSINMVEQLLNYIDGKEEKENTTNT